MRTIIEGKHVKIHTENVHGELLIDDHDLSQKVSAFSVNWEVGSIPTLTIKYACHEQLTIEGEMEVVHVCPKVARK